MIQSTTPSILFNLHQELDIVDAVCVVKTEQKTITKGISSMAIKKNIVQVLLSVADTNDLQIKNDIDEKRTPSPIQVFIQLKVKTSDSLTYATKILKSVIKPIMEELKP